MDSGLVVGGFTLGLAVWFFTLGSYYTWQSFKRIANG